MTWDYPWLSVLIYVAALEAWLITLGYLSLSERVRRGHAVILRLTYIVVVAALYAHFFHGWLG